MSFGIMLLISIELYQVSFSRPFFKKNLLLLLLVVVVTLYAWCRDGYDIAGWVIALFTSPEAGNVRLIKHNQQQQQPR